MAQMQITQQALMLGQNMDNQTSDPQSDVNQGLKGKEGLLPNEKGGYALNSSFGLSNHKKSQRQVQKNKCTPYLVSGKPTYQMLFHSLMHI